MEIALRDIRIKPILESVRREKMSDEVYFKDYKDYISNSKLKLINPAQEGSIEKWLTGFKDSASTSLVLGSSVHELLLQPECFSLGPDLNKPTAKLGAVIDSIKKHRLSGKTIYNSICAACEDVDYYRKSYTKKIIDIIKAGLGYYINSKNYDESVILLSTKDRQIVENCLASLEAIKVNRILNPTDLFGDPILSYNEDAFFMDFKIGYEDKEGILKIKMKADNWTIDVDNKIITLNDLKTTGHLCCQFMKPGGSLETFHYERQFAYYLYILLRYCEREYGYNPEEWTVKCNVIVVETTADNRASIFPITPELLEKGRQEFCKLLKMVSYYELMGYENEVVFI